MTKVRLDEDSKELLRDTIRLLIDIGKRGELERGDAPLLYDAISTILALNRALVPLLEVVPEDGRL